MTISQKGDGRSKNLVGSIIEQQGFASKGQLISEQIDAVLNFPKMQQNIARISTLASKLGQIKKSKSTFSS